MKAIVRRSAAVVTFVGLLGLTLTSANASMSNAAPICSCGPTPQDLAQLAALELPGVDASNLADFFRISPWDSDDLALALVRIPHPY